jgi:SAM-dependent methyltransferase
MPDHYLRTIFQCQSCLAYINFHDLLDEDFYTAAYNEAITLGNLEKRFQKIMALPKEASDNKQRVNRIISFMNKNVSRKAQPHVLDVGCGTGVFPHEMKTKGYFTACIDPDESAIAHARKTVKVDMAHHGDLFDFTTKEKFDLITFNKVLEHLKDPVKHLIEATRYLKNDGVVYIELPEGDRIVEEEKIRERAEFAIEHYIIFNDTSVKKLAELSKMSMFEAEVITDPSGKYTIFAFLRLSRRN